MKKKKKLASTLSGLLDQAVEDSISVSRMPGYRLNMAKWHNPLPVRGTRRKVCEVCMAGSMMVRQFGVPRLKFLMPRNLAPGKAQKLIAVDSMRFGNFKDAANLIGIYLTAEQEESLRKATELIQMEMRGPLNRAPWRVYRRAARMLREAGL